MKLKYTKLQIVIEIVTILVLVGMYVFLFLTWDSLPDKIPGHYDAAGVVNRWGSKNELIALPVITTVLYLLLSAVLMFPILWSLPGKVTEDNIYSMYSNVRYLLIFMKLEIVIMFTYILYNDTKAQNLSPFYLPLVLILIFGTIGVFMARIIKASHSKV